MEWSEVDTSEVEFLYLNLQLKDGFRKEVAKAMSYHRVLFEISTVFSEHYYRLSYSRLFGIRLSIVNFDTAKDDGGTGQVVTRGNL